MTCCCPDLGGASDWSSSGRNFLQPIRSTIPIWVVARAAWNFCTRSSDFISRETSGGVRKCQLFFQSNFIALQHKIFVISSILLLRKKQANNQFSKCSKLSCVQNEQVLDSLERQWSFKTEESHTYRHLNLCIKHYAS